ncbi:MAG: hypothetical protein VZQ55_03530 [Ruminococcus sp.]|nr:hypothetical protein [Ruminococcus sp.]
MSYKKAYIIVRSVIFIWMILMFITIDAVVFYYRDFILYFLFIPIEALFIFLWFLLVKINSNAIVKINTNKGKIELITLGDNYKTTADKIKIKKGGFYHYFFIDDIKLKANSSNKSVQSFLYKYQNIYKNAKN